MKLCALTRVRIDGDIVEEFVRHTLRFVDEIFIVDNMSPDATFEILQALKAEGLPLSIRQDDVVEARFDQMAHYARWAFEESAADYLLLLDADEFVRVGSRAKLEGVLSALPPDTHGLVPWITYVPQSGEDTSEPRVLARIQHRHSREEVQYHKIFLSRSFAEDDGAIVSQGNHAILKQNGAEAQSAPLDDVTLGHFPVRSVTQLQCKVLLGWCSFLAAGYDEENGMGYQWRRLYDKLRSNPRWDAEEFYIYAARYLGSLDSAPARLVFDPIAPVPRRYSPVAPSLLDVALAFTRELAVQHAILRGENERLANQGSVVTAST